MTEIAKTYIPGKGWVKAIDQPKSVLREAAHGGRAQDARVRAFKEKKDHDTYRQTHKGLKELGEQLKGSSHINTVKVPTGAMHHEASSRHIDQLTGGGVQAFAFKTGGRRAPGHLVTTKDADPGIVAHERAHLSPKRTAYRMHHQLTNNVGAMKEEARADMASGDPRGYHGDHRSKGSNALTGYTEAARDEGARLIQQTHNPHKHKMWSKESMEGYRQTQDQINRARGGTPQTAAPYKPQPQPKRSKTRHITADNIVRGASGAGIAGAGVYGAKKYRDKKQVAKGLDMHEGVRSLVSKMGPDPSELHAWGSSGQKKKLRKLPPNAVRRSR